MRRRLLRSTLLVATVSVLVLGVPLAIVGAELLRQRADMRLEQRADAAALALTTAVSRGRELRRAIVAPVIGRDEAIEVRRDGRTLTLGTPPSGDVVRVRSGDGGPLRVALLSPAAARNDDVGLVWLAVAGSAVVALLVAAALALVQARRLARPLELLAQRVRAVGGPGFDPEPVAGDVPEIEAVQTALGDADERIGELLRREREFAANASHQLRSPLTGLRLRVEELHRIAASSDARHEADAALAQIDRLTDTIAHLQRTAHVGDDRPPATDLEPLVSQHLAREQWARRFAERQRELDVDLAPVVGRMHPESARQILDVLLDNALVHGRGRVRIHLERIDDRARLEVADEGAVPVGVADPFARGVGTGSGIGLHLARELARHGGGDLLLEDGGAARFALLVPIARPR